MADETIDAAAKSRVIHDFDFDKPGKHIGYLRVPQSRNDGAWATIEIPIAVINGSKGPSVLFTGGVHGDEYEGQIAVARLTKRLDPKCVRGRVILMPAVDLPAALAGRRLCPLDGRDLNRCFPGDARGTFCQILAHFIDSAILPLVEVTVDVHAAGHSMEAALSSNMHFVEDRVTLENTLSLAEAFAAPYNVVFWGVDEGATLGAAVERRKILSIGAELGGYGRVSIAGVRIAERGLDNVLKSLGIIDGEPERSQSDGSPKTKHMEVRDRKGYVFAPGDGLFEPRHEAGAAVSEGELAGDLHFVEDWSRESIAVHYRSSGTLWMAMGPGRARKGDVVAVVMKPFAEI